MAPVDEAIADPESRDTGEQLTFKEVVEKWGVDRSTLGQCWRRVTGPRSNGYVQQKTVGPQQELELVRCYITKPIKQALPPMREMIRNFSPEVAHRELSESWVTRFMNRHKLHLVSKWTGAMNRTLHLGDSESKHKLYFDLLH